MTENSHKQLRTPQSDFQISTKSMLDKTIAHDLECRGLPSRWNHAYRITNRISYFQWLLRRVEYLSQQDKKSPVARARLAVLGLRKKLLGERLGLDIPKNVFGPGLSIAHAGMIVVSGSARVGSRCRIHQGVSIVAAQTGSPSIGNDVFIGPNVVVVGGISIGDGAYLYPGAVVTSDVPAESGARGVPAKVCVKGDVHSHGDVMKIDSSRADWNVTIGWNEPFGSRFSGT